MSSSNTARLFLGLNAGSSLLIGVGLLAAAEPIANMIFATSATWQPIALRVLGVGLLAFALVLFLMTSDRFVGRKAVMLITLLDIGWVAGSLAMLVFGRSLLTDPGVALVAVVAGLVLVFAIGQSVGAGAIAAPKSRASVRTSDGRLHATVRRTVNAPADAVWTVMSDHPGYADVASNISKVEVLSGDGIGMQRRCYGPKGESWRETCDLFEEGKAFGFKIHTDADDYPYPISDLQGRWAVMPKGAGSEFSIDISAKPKGGFFKRALFRMAAMRTFKSILIDLADAWADRMEKQARA